MLSMYYQSHIGSWAIMIILFFVSYFLLKARKEKGAKIIQMILRLFYLIMIVSGVGMLVIYQFPLLFVFKGVLALVLLYAMEMILVGTKKGTLGSKASMYWILFAVSLIVVVVIGYSNN
ncbi:YisL family protein [Halalkalibacter urbisdiaboli]|uniref:YisL family protein n=1 Tax=Halalkalibacter urbisdiaboli TaxID=1960589 RepID=UPI000B431A28|nr:YisL family protein [Halalkalibacter urbisdiaboli]